MSSRGPARADAQEPGAHRALIGAIREALAAAGDPERAAGQQRYMKSAMPYRGLTSPVLRATLKPILSATAYDLADRGTWEATVRALWDEAAYREERYAALAVAGHRRYRSFRDVATLPLYADLSRTGAWWDLVDDIATHHVAPVLLGDTARPLFGGLGFTEMAQRLQLEILETLRIGDDLRLRLRSRAGATA